MNRNTANRLTIAASITAVLLICSATGRLMTVTLDKNYCETVEVTAARCDAAESVPADFDNAASATAVSEPPLASADAEINAPEDELNKARQAARELIKSVSPDLKQDGVFALELWPGELYLAGVDTSSSGKHRTIDVLVRRYVRKGGASYYRAESLGPDQAAKYLEMASKP